jgi:RNA polymerase-binding transcription factor DksA
MFPGKVDIMAGGKNKALVKKLKKEQAQALQELARQREALRAEVDPDVDEGDPDLVEREKVMALVQGLEHKLESIEYAVHPAQEGTYGICKRCGQPIDPARLEVVPEATLCVKCKAIVERQARLSTSTAQLQ